MNSLNALAWRNLTSNRLRVILSITAVLFGVAATIATNVITQSLRKALVTSEDMVQIMGGLIDQMDTMTLFVAVVIMLAAGFLIFNAFAMSVTQRRQQIGAMRSLGMTRGQIMRLILTEALIICVTGLILGLLAGPLFGRFVIAILREFGRGLLAFSEADPTLSTIILAVALGLGATALATIFPARRAARISPLDALREPEASTREPSGKWRPLVGMVLIVGLLLHIVMAPPGEWVTFPLDANLAALFTLIWITALILILPSFIGLCGRMVERWFGTRGAVGRLIADNLRRARSRVMLTVLTLAFALTVITGLTGFFDFVLNKMIVASLQASIERDNFFVGRIDVAGGWEAMTKLDLSSVLVSEDEYAAIVEKADGRATIQPTFFVTIPELSFIGNTYFSYLMEADSLIEMGSAAFQMREGDWVSAAPILKSACGALVTPLVANKNNAKLGDTITITAKNGPMDCTIAGIGTGVAGASIVTTTRPDMFGITTPVLVQVVPKIGVDSATLLSDMNSLKAQYPLLSVTTVKRMAEVQESSLDIILLSFNVLLVLAVFAAAMGVINTTVMSVSERRKEIGLLRSVGATKAQVRNILMGEAAVMGLIGGVFGLVAGVGFVIIFVMTYGTNSIGLVTNLWQTALDSTRLAFTTGLVGLIAAPIIAALAAHLPARSVLREKLV